MLSVQLSIRQIHPISFRVKFKILPNLAAFKKAPKFGSIHFNVRHSSLNIMVTLAMVNVPLYEHWECSHVQIAPKFGGSKKERLHIWERLR